MSWGVVATVAIEIAGFLKVYNLVVVRQGCTPNDFPNGLCQRIEFSDPKFEVQEASDQQEHIHRAGHLRILRQSLLQR